MTRFKKVILFFHRWLGLISGLVVFIVSITGCIFCFQDEIQDALYSFRKVEVQNKPYLPPSRIEALFKANYPKANADYIYYYGKGRPAAVLSNMGDKGFYYIFFNPYTGQLTHTERAQSNLFVIVEYIHLYLLLPPKIGGMVVGISVLIFVILMITGIILWWPKRKTDRKRSFTIKWNGRWRRVNYDLHNVLGFYATAIALVLAITGLSMSFEWVRNGIYKTANLGKNYTAEKILPKSDSLQKGFITTQPVIDRGYEIAKQRSPKAQMYLVFNDRSATGTIEVTAFAKTFRYYKSDSYMFDKYTGQLLRTMPHIKKSPGMKMNEMNYDVHVGQILGFTGKIIAFLASLICASLPVTGFIIWWGKRKKSKTKKIRTIVHRKTHKHLQAQGTFRSS
ncbi:PepSY-associated TM helix domain-containing protein [Mucilaginibacter segetis]|uniref:PepSY domain-containing protein n=1 Tax=Mucilaginibacter segetis TaxID=2793071 RepID=A0A934UNC6_9SPHI|nr:PepSY-associated TM helix domain-containing protein [Mucilaginibacter segetis]MBK0379761.1 PepSY domain-containing protein [Mucilaginibacter segetis]